MGHIQYGYAIRGIYDKWYAIPGSVCNIRVNGPVAGDTLFLISINIDLIEHVKQLNMHIALDLVLCV